MMGWVVLLAISIGEAIVLLVGPFGMPGHRTVTDYLFLALIFSHFGWGYLHLRSRLQKFNKNRSNPQVPNLGIIPRVSATLWTASVLFGISLVLFLFSYIFAINANMDYIQRFALGKANIRIAPDSLVQRLNSLLRYLPFLLFDGALVTFRRSKKILRSDDAIRDFVLSWPLPLVFLSVFLYTASLPSFVSLEGIPILAYFCLVPLFLVLHYSTKRETIFYGTLFGVLQMMLTHFWLGTFSLITLQLVSIAYALFFIVFMYLAKLLMVSAAGDANGVALLAPAGANRARGILLLPVAWVFFDYLRSIGFIGFPWGMIGTSQYKAFPLIQLAATTGVWGVSFVVLLCNAVLAYSLVRGMVTKRLATRPLILFAAFFAAVILWGGLSARRIETIDPHEQVRVALVQQNTDPRKNDYREGLNALIELTNEALDQSPDLVAWSETAFVPNIRRWGAMPRYSHSYARIVHDFLDYQKSMNTWLVTGNDDYLIEIEKDGEEVRYDFNASILFDPQGNRVDTYHKVRLVPFTEYFPVRKSFPSLYEWIKTFDVYLWEPGTERLVFNHPKFSFATPICFEDSFPGDVRRFVVEGAEVILNLSNDYWSLTEVEAQQHFANGLFRAIENRRPLLRATASGVTTSVSLTGRWSETLPYYEAGVMVVEVPLRQTNRSLYLVLGDWFPLLCAFICLVTYSLGLLRMARKKRTVSRNSQDSAARGGN